MEQQCDATRFQNDTATHVMEVLRDDGVYRHIRFREPGTMCYHFDLITWPGYLCYTGDMGTYVFTRLADMFDFFRKQPGHEFSIDFRYWAEKCTAGDKSSYGNGIREFSIDKFKANVLEWINGRENNERPDPEDLDAVRLHAAAFAELRAEVKSEVCGCDDNSVRAYDAANDFEHDGEAWQAYFGPGHKFYFRDFWEVNHDVYTFHFLWCCYALAWGVNQYDAAKAAAELAEQPVTT